MKIAYPALCLLIVPMLLSAGDDPNAEILDLLHRYNRAVGEGNVEVISESVYAVPSYLAFGNRMITFNSEQDVRIAFENLVTSLRDDGYDRSDVEVQSLCVFNEWTAILSITFTRRRTDSSVIGSGEATYIVRRLPEGWRVFLATGHDSDRVPTC